MQEQSEQVSSSEVGKKIEKLADGKSFESATKKEFRKHLYGGFFVKKARGVFFDCLNAKMSFTAAARDTTESLCTTFLGNRGAELRGLTIPALSEASWKRLRESAGWGALERISIPQNQEDALINAAINIILDLAIKHARG